MSKFLDVLEQLKMYKNFDTLEQVQKLGLEHLSLQHCVHWASYLKIMYYSPYIQEKKIHTSAGFEFSACISKMDCLTKSTSQKLTNYIQFRPCIIYYDRICGSPRKTVLKNPQIQSKHSKNTKK